jgi:3-polyprenyl-4-hydroxybenzoate decarboxylase
MVASRAVTATTFVDLRGYLDALDERGLLCRVDARVDWDPEVGAIQRLMFDRGGPGLYFSDVRDSSVPLVSGLMATRSGTRSASAASPTCAPSSARCGWPRSTRSSPW